MTQECPSRRALLQRLAAIGVTGIAAGAVTGCGDDEPAAAGVATGKPAPVPSSAQPSSAEPTADPGEDGTEGDADPAVSGIPVAQVPVGKAQVVDLGGQRAVLAQPGAGRFVAFSARCTHQGSVVAVSSGLQLTCPAHGSRFDAADGSVRRGPAEEPLERIRVRVRAGQVVPVSS